MTYSKFCTLCEENKKFGVTPVAFITKVSKNFVTYWIEDRGHKLPIQQFIDDISKNGMGNVENPEELKNWSGWSK